MASGWTNKGRHGVLGGTINLLTDTIKVMLVNATTSIDPDLNFVSQISANELSGTGYTGGFGGAGRKTLASKTVTEDDTNDRAYFDAADLTWTAINAGTPVMALIIKEITNDAASIVIGWVDVNDIATNGGDYTVAWDANGILRLT
jgi:hypothetical protein